MSYILTQLFSNFVIITYRIDRPKTVGQWRLVTLNSFNIDQIRLVNGGWSTIDFYFLRYDFIGYLSLLFDLKHISLSNFRLKTIFRWDLKIIIFLTIEKKKIKKIINKIKNIQKFKKTLKKINLKENKYDI